MKVLNIGEQFIVKIETGEGMKYIIIDNLINPFELIKTLSEKEVNEYG